jgi:hypothetical protein
VPFAVRVWEGSWLVVRERAPIQADSAGWRKWCAENPEKCPGEHSGEAVIVESDEIMYAGRSQDDSLMFLPIWVDDLEAAGAAQIATLSDRERARVEAYTGHGYKFMNEQVRAQNDKGKLFAAAIEAASIDLKDENGDPPLVWRGLRVRGTVDDVLAKYPIGSTLRTTKLTSTTLAQPNGIRFATDRRYTGDDVGVLMEITAKRGAPVNGLSFHSDEHEVVLPYGSELRVTGIERRTVRYSNGNDFPDEPATPASKDERLIVVMLEQL